MRQLGCRLRRPAEKSPIFECVAAPPAPGFRDAYGNRGHGQLWFVGSAGYSWSSNNAGNKAYFLSFDYGEIHPQVSLDCAYGLQLRCLQE